jgi:hypothetical protein
MADLADDSDDKARRNLVLFSTLILLGAWLDLKPDALVARILGNTPAAEVSLVKLWCAVGAAQFYLAWRFQYVTPTRVATDHARKERAAGLKQAAESLLWEHLRRHTTAGKPSKLFEGNLSDPVANYAKGLAQLDEVSTGAVGRPNFGAETEIVFQRKGFHGPNVASHEVGYVRPHYAWPKRNAFGEGHSIRFHIVGWHRYRVRAVAAWQLCMSSKTGIDIAAPVAMAAAAIAVVAFQITSHWFAT